MHAADQHRCAAVQLAFKVHPACALQTTCVVTFVMHPSSLFVLGALLGGWIYLVFVRRDPIVIGGRQLRCGALHMCCIACALQCTQADFKDCVQRCLVL